MNEVTRRDFVKATAAIGMLAMWPKAALAAEKPKAPKAPGKSAIVKDQMLISKSPDKYPQVRYLVLKGTDREIGYSLAELAKRELDTKLPKYAAPVYGQARRLYLQHNFPALWERSRGVAAAFGLSEDDNHYDTSALVFGMGSLACSAVYFPAHTTTNGHALVCRNNDFYIVSAAQLFGKPERPQDLKLYEYLVINALHPAKGNAALQLGSFDLLNLPTDGVNQHGLYAAGFTDQQAAQASFPIAGGSDSGLCVTQLLSLLMNKCRSVQEAKLAILQQHLYFTVEPVHHLLADTSGDVAVFETDPKSGKYIFVDGVKGKPFIITNHALHLYPTPASFPQVDPKIAYNTFNRYRKLEQALAAHQGKWSVEDCFQIMAQVYGNAMDKEEAGTFLPYPLRTLYTMVMDLTDPQVTIKFYLRDGTKEKDAKIANLVFSEPFNIKLKSS